MADTGIAAGASHGSGIGLGFVGGTTAAIAPAKPKKKKDSMAAVMADMLKQEELSKKNASAPDTASSASVRPASLLPDSAPLLISAGATPVASILPAPPPHVLSSKGSYDQGDLHTTNVYVGSLHPTVDEERLVMEFGKFGDISSVKIMWPRTQEEHDRGRNCGFVSFMQRSSAEAAMQALHGTPLNGLAITVVWSKRVQLPAKPLFTKKAVLWALRTGRSVSEYQAAAALAVAMGHPDHDHPDESPAEASRAAGHPPNHRAASAAVGSMTAHQASSDPAATGAATDGVSVGGPAGAGDALPATSLSIVNPLSPTSAEAKAAGAENESVVYAIPSGTPRFEVVWPKDHIQVRHFFHLFFCKVSIECFLPFLRSLGDRCIIHLYFFSLYFPLGNLPAAQLD